ncbi:MAG: pimeloyl-CoA dehydrogenase large subunit [Rhodospirillaceae bacterium]|nr:pimeloyl-CoA dehydrogenase large subunit [Rhodospirillaceae bacterium]
MDIQYSDDELAFRDEVRAFIAENHTPEIKAKTAKSMTGYIHQDDHVTWQKALHKKGWIATNWPVEHGGPGWSATQKYIYDTEMLRAGTLRPVAFGLKMVAPVIMEFGTEEQKQKYLPDILQSNVWWCQGYSEPGSGSDLASLQTRAIPDGDDYIVNGSKIWTTMAQRADMIFCLVRTSTEGKRQEGISFLLIDMTTPGIKVEPIVLLDQTDAPEQEVNQVFFTDVRVPQTNRVGKENDGWTVAKYLLEFERGNAYAGGLHGGLGRVREIAKQERGDGARLIDDPAFAAKLAALEVTARAVEYTELRTLSALGAGQRVGASSSILKCQGSTMTQEVGELAVEAMAYYASPFDRGVLDAGANVEPIGPDYAAAAAGRYFNQRKATIYGGSNEVQHEIVAKRILGM